MNGMRRVRAARSGSVVGRSRRGRGGVFTTAVRRVEAHRAHRHRSVYVAQARPAADVDQTTAEYEVTGRRDRLAEIPRHAPYSPLAGTVLRPLGDAATTIQILLRRW
jgi:hypothetical protein